MPLQPKVKKQSQEVDITTNLSRSLGQGLLFGFADETEAFIRSLTGSKNYNENLTSCNANKRMISKDEFSTIKRIF